jgi:hypothetical protein
LLRVDPLPSLSGAQIRRSVSSHLHGPGQMPPPLRQAPLPTAPASIAPFAARVHTPCVTADRLAAAVERAEAGLIRIVQP